MTAEGTRFTRDGTRTLLVALASALLASCATSDPDVPFGFAAADIQPVSGAAHSATGFAADAASDTTAAFVVDEDDPELPDIVAAAPMVRPGSEFPQPSPAAIAADMTTAPVATAQPAATPGAPEAAPAAGDAVAEAAAAPVPVAADAGTSAAEAVAGMSAPAHESAASGKKRSFLSAFFSPAAPAAGKAGTARPLIDPAASQPATAAAAAPARPLLQLASTGGAAASPTARSGAANANPLPGVRQNSLFEISRRSGLDDDSDIDLHEGDEPSYQVASAAGMARLAPNGLLKQTDNVDVACLKPSLVRVLKAVESHYGRKVVVTSGYRSPDRNRRARGARNSLHMYCAAADVQVEGVSKWDLAQFVRSMPGRGGVGTYCHTDSVHIDVGPERDWNWRCRRRK